jgi:large subunit ribosomal protein L17
MYTNRKKMRMQGKTPSHRKSIIKSQIESLVRTGRIKTTTAKAKVIKSEFDKLVNMYKKNTGASLRNVLSFFTGNEIALAKFEKIVKEYLTDRTSGYTRVIKTLPRKGDNSEQSYIMLVNTEAKAAKSKIKKAIEKKKVAEDKQAEKSVVNRIGKTIGKITGPKEVVKESTTKQKRISM